MFRLNKNRPAKSSAEKIDFKLSHFKVLQVPKGWDKLFISIVLVETGKTIAKLNKVSVRNGGCQWTEAITESIWLSHDDSSKDSEAYSYKFVVAMGSVRSGVLGEATVNMTSYMNSGTSVPLSVPLKKCNHGTVLQVKIHCLTPRAELRGDGSKDTEKEDVKSDGSRNTVARGSDPPEELDSALNQEEVDSKETSFFESGSNHSYDSSENSSRKEKLLPREDISGDYPKLTDEENSIGSHGVPKGFYSGSDHSHSDHLSVSSQKMELGNKFHTRREEFAASSKGNAGSSKNLLEAAEDTIEEIRAEAKMWERNARKLMLDLDILRKEFSDLSRKQANLDIELAVSKTERDTFKKEVEHLKLLLEKSRQEQEMLDNSTCQNEDVICVQKELEAEIKLQKETNVDLSLQLSRNQESNIELVSVLQELEEMVEKQKHEIENLTSLQSKMSNMEESLVLTMEENKELKAQLQQLRNSEDDLKVNLQALEQALEDEKQTIRNDACLGKSMSSVEEEYRRKLSAKEEEIAALEGKLSEFLIKQHSRDFREEGDACLIEEIESLKEKTQELERDCNELTEENLELLFKLKEINKSSQQQGASESSARDFSEKVVSSLNCNLGKNESCYDISTQKLEIVKVELESKIEKLFQELSEERSEKTKLEEILHSKEWEVKELRQAKGQLEAMVSDLQKQMVQLQEKLQDTQRESYITTKCFTELQNDLVSLSSSVDSHVSANKVLERKSSKLEMENCELELHLSALENEKAQMSLRISDLETQHMHLTDNKKSSQMEIENSQALCERLRNEMTQLKETMETRMMELEEDSLIIRNQLSEAVEKCECLREENGKLQASMDDLVEECTSLQKSNAELMKQNLDLHEDKIGLNTKLKEVRENLGTCFNKVDVLEGSLTSMLEDFALKEGNFTSELDALLDENTKQKEQLIQGESLLNQMYMEKTAEVENRQHELECLAEQISEDHAQRERFSSDAACEMSNLRACRDNLELTLQEAQCKMKLMESEMNIMKMEYDMKIQGLVEDLAPSKQEYEMLLATKEKLSRQLENQKSSEEKLRTTLNELELKLTVSEYERQKLLDESADHKVQLEKIEHLQAQVSSLKNELRATKVEKEKMEASFQSVLEECKRMEEEKRAFVEKVTLLENAVSELADCRENKISLEKKLLWSEAELVVKEAQVLEAAELKNKLLRLTKENRQNQETMQQLEEKKNEYVRKIREQEEELKHLKEEKHNQKHFGSKRSLSTPKSTYKVIPIGEDVNVSKKEMVRSTFQQLNNRKKSLPKKETQNQMEDHHDPEADDDSFHSVEVDPRSMVPDNDSPQLSRADEGVEVSNKRMLSEAGDETAETPNKSLPESEVVPRGKHESIKSSLEAELKDIQERYLHMSLKYAEVEAQREELVMKLKTANARTGKRWFS